MVGGLFLYGCAHHSCDLRARGLRSDMLPPTACVCGAETKIDQIQPLLPRLDTCTTLHATPRAPARRAIASRRPGPNSQQQRDGRDGQPTRAAPPNGVEAVPAARGRLRVAGPAPAT